MGAAALLLSILLYAAVATAYLWDGRRGMALAFAAYAVANVGFLMDMVWRR